MRFTMAAGGEAGQIQHFDWIPLNDPSSTPQLRRSIQITQHVKSQFAQSQFVETSEAQPWGNVTFLHQVLSASHSTGQYTLGIQG